MSLDSWISASGVPFPKTKSDIEEGLEKLFSNGILQGGERSQQKRRRQIDELWEISPDAKVIAEVISNVIEKKEKCHINYISAILRNGPKQADSGDTGAQAKEIKEVTQKAPVETKPIESVEKERPDGNLNSSLGVYNHSSRFGHSPEVASPVRSPTGNWDPKLSSFEFPPEIRPTHVGMLTSRGISPEFALASGVRFAADNDLRKLSFDASINKEQRQQGLQGLAFAYCDLETREERTYRLKPDYKFAIGGNEAKYLSRKGDPCQAYYPHTTTAEMAKNVKWNVIITEGEFKALSLAQNVIPICSRPTCVIGLQGVNGGWHRDVTTRTNPDGSKENIKEGAPHLIDDLEDWEWKKRVVYIIFDSDVGTKKQAEEFKRSKRSGAIGAEYTLALLLKAKGAEVRIVIIPHDLGGDKIGADDYIVSHGPREMLKLLYNNWVVERNVDEILYKGEGCNIQFEWAEDLVARAPKSPGFILDRIIPIGGVAILGGSPGVGKSFFALSLCYSVSIGIDFLGIKVNGGNTAYIQTEIPEDNMCERISSLDHIPEKRMIIYSPHKMKLNLWESDGYNKRRDTGNRQVVSSLIQTFKDFSIKLAVFDPMKHFHTNPENDIDAMGDLLQLFREIARSVGCGILIVHHHKKSSSDKIAYEGGEHLRGASTIESEVDSILQIYSKKSKNGTSRIKLNFTKLRHSPPKDDLEIYRPSETTLCYECQPWVDTITQGGKSILEVINDSRGGMKAADAIKQCSIPASSFYRNVNKLISEGLIIKIKDLYFVSGNEDDE